MVILQLHSCT